MLSSEMKKENYFASLLWYDCTAKQRAVQSHPAELSRSSSIAVAVQLAPRLSRRKKQVSEGGQWDPEPQDCSAVSPTAHTGSWAVWQVLVLTLRSAGQPSRI